jgi:hypothetical protein
LRPAICEVKLCCLHLFTEVILGDECICPDTSLALSFIESDFFFAARGEQFDFELTVVVKVI